MTVRSLPHFSHKPIGKSTHKKGYSYQHVNYTTREAACSHVLAENMPADQPGARPFFERAAYQEGVPDNARIADTLIIALPIEFSRELRHEAVQGFMARIGQGRIAWLAAFHDMGKDEHNPHCHIIFRDADIETGRKVVGTTTSAKDVRIAEERGWRVPPRTTTKDLRQIWCEHLNAEMSRHGYSARFDARSLKSQGIARTPGIHVGPKAMSMARKGKAVTSRDQNIGNRAISYSLLDEGSRFDHNRRIAEANRQGRPFSTAGDAQLSALRERWVAGRKALYQEQRLDRDALRQAHKAQNLVYKRWARSMRTAASKQAATVQPLPLAETWKRLKNAQEAERRELFARHKQENAELSKQQAAERRALTGSSTVLAPAAGGGAVLSRVSTAEYTALADRAAAARTKIRSNLTVWRENLSNARKGMPTGIAELDLPVPRKGAGSDRA